MKLDSLVLRDLSFTYGSKHATDEYVFDRLSYELPLDRVVCFRGPTGAGKQTLLKLLAALENPLRGEFLVNGENLFAWGEVRRFTYRRRIGYGFSYGGLLQNRSLVENLELAARSLTEWDERTQAAAVRESLDRFGLYESRDQRPSLVSGSMRMAACLARAFLHRPEAVILSQPTNGLNESMLVALRELIEVHRAERGLRHVYAVSDNEDFFRPFDPLLVEVSRERIQAA